MNQQIPEERRRADRRIARRRLSDRRSVQRHATIDELRRHLQEGRGGSSAIEANDVEEILADAEQRGTFGQSRDRRSTAHRRKGERRQV
jgi:hypothetical protein